MRGMRFQLVQTTCRRCGKALMTGNRSLFGADAAKARLDSICEGCVTDAERVEMMDAQAAAILGRAADVGS